MKAFRDDMHRRLAAQGRDPDSCKVLFVVAPTLEEPNEEAGERVRRRQAQREPRQK